MLNLLFELKKEKIISDLNYQFATFIESKQMQYNYPQQQKDLAVLLAALISYQVGLGHTALRLNSLELSNLFELSTKPQCHHILKAILQKIGKISPLEWQEVLKDHIAFSHLPEKIAPMLFQNGLLYFYRYWQAEHNIAVYLQQAVKFSEKFTNAELNKKIIEQLFERQSNPQQEIDWQKVAVATALEKQFSLISGGPGTGKTTTVVKLLLGLQLKQRELHQPFLQIALAAPTGKAAARMKESIEGKLAEEKQLSPELIKAIPTEAITIHRLLGARPLTDETKYNVKNPLHYDLVVLDEASMIDVSMMEKIVQALKPTACLIMLGDKDQLASVEAGSIMGELASFLAYGYSQSHCDYLKKVTGYEIEVGNALAIGDSLAHLKHSYRFGEKMWIGELANAVNDQKINYSWEIFAKYQDSGKLENRIYPETKDMADKSNWLEKSVQMVVDKAVELYRAYLTAVQQREENPQAMSVKTIFDKFQKVRFLSALRVSELGVEKLNVAIAEGLRKAGLVRFNHSRDRYIGKPILITENMPTNKIASGDIGIILSDENGETRVYFDSQQSDEQYHSLPLSRIPSYEAAYIMTVHKSQGSEFEHTVLVLPLVISPVLTKELIYTAITRAKDKFTLFGSEKVWKYSVGSKTERQSGLKEQLISKFC
ncbi:Exodeoxyribonuclease V, alpha subunit [Mannheimia sp. USDA-ARS-USMARC-1261]|uniref:exodeoxyribonuclease V subunit alpha n=1 Tax=Mannheimia sp. USDA-ARS-USMARC-1261 TaxID=1432056 RepID=UPI0003E3696A|nr:exodeoxyribonuclease V subunit alpha [Mannheimia sp. USDA-ARS-USMARC-1261]AHG72780.1 Exodeoxyribonuclease V, alpha subunit [Mannheimia sp. USDA-ARS-USMARC-1261]